MFKKGLIILLLNLLFFEETKAQGIASIGGVVNLYAPVDSIDICTNSLFINSGLAINFKTGDTVLLIQMKGAYIATAENSAFGDVLDYRDAGNYEINYVSNVIGRNTVVLTNFLSRPFDFSRGYLQLVKIPYYKSAAVNSTLTCTAWDGRVGGITALIVQDTLTLNADIDVSGKGFAGGSGKNKNRQEVVCDFQRYYCPGDTVAAAYKGESFAIVSPDKTGGRGKLAAGGGSGEAHNSGGGGGGNGGAGGNGGYQFERCDTLVKNQGIGGVKIPYSTAANKIFLGSGGGGGHANNFVFNSDGGNGGGLVLIIANYIDGNGNTILSNGAGAVQCSIDLADSNKCREGMGGGGSGGTVLIQSPNYISSLNIMATGGRGGDISEPASQYHGPGAGGGGGVAWVSNMVFPAAVSTNISKGMNGLNLFNNNNPWGATPGEDGSTFTSLSVPFTAIPFQKNIDTVSFANALTGCSTVQFNALATVFYSPVILWQWSFGDGTNGNGQNIIHDYSAGGNFNVTLTAVDFNNCKDTAGSIVVIPVNAIDAGIDTTICKNTAFTLHGIGGNSFDWQPAAFLNNSTTKNPNGQVSSTTTFYLSSDFGSGCIKTDSVFVNVYPNPLFAVNNNIAICDKQQVQLSASGADSYLWSPPDGLSGVSVANPISNATQTTPYSVFMTSNLCGDTATLNTTVFVLPLPVVQATKSNDLDCSNGIAQLNATGGASYTWSPATGLTNINIPNPKANPTSTTVYTVTAKGQNSCINKDSLTLNVNINGQAVLNMPNAFTPNGDGINDCFGIKYLAVPENIDFSIFNRWGLKLFTSNNTYNCWNGTYNNINQDAGTYVYYVKAKTICGDVFVKGTVVLIR